LIVVKPVTFAGDSSTMRIVLVTISLTLLPMLIGCATYEPVPISAIPDWELQSEYDQLVIEQGQLTRLMKYGGRNSSTKFTVNQSGEIVKTETYVDNSMIYELDGVEDRIREIQSEMLRRTTMGYQTATPQQKAATPQQKYSVYSITHSRLFHHSECSKLTSNDGNLIVFSSKEDAKKNGGEPCPECNL
jgi:hypothetical protein|tara:strand:+ start:153 stop:719 length:567 start_codon:yes stop_codon:yes gene_type:complete